MKLSPVRTKSSVIVHQNKVLFYEDEFFYNKMSGTFSSFFLLERHILSNFGVLEFKVTMRETVYRRFPEKKTAPKNHQGFSFLFNI